MSMRSRVSKSALGMVFPLWEGKSGRLDRASVLWVEEDDFCGAALGLEVLVARARAKMASSLGCRA